MTKASRVPVIGTLLIGVICPSARVSAQQRPVIADQIAKTSVSTRVIMPSNCARISYSWLVLVLGSLISLASHALRRPPWHRFWRQFGDG